MKFTIKYIVGGLIALLLMGLSACKMDLEQEIWLKKNNSGKAKVFVHLNIPMGYDAASMDEMDMNSNSALKAMMEKAKGIKGVEITRFDTETQHSEEEMNFLYTYEFNFADLKGLQAALCLTDEKGISMQKGKKGKVLSLDALQFMIVEEADQETLAYLEYVDTNLKTTIHLPKKPKFASAEGVIDKKNKTVSWTAKITQDWYSQAEQIMQVIF